MEQRIFPSKKETMDSDDDVFGGRFPRSEEKSTLRLGLGPSHQVPAVAFL